MISTIVLDDVVSYEANQSMYRLLMTMASLDPLKINIIMTLAHISPMRVTGTELTLLLGYSKKARTIYRGVLDELQELGFITVEKPKPKQHHISVNQEHPMMKNIVELTLQHGDKFSEVLIEKVKERRDFGIE